jgi:hypothetical protein
MFGATVVLKLVVYAVMWFGVYLGIRALIDGRVGFGLLILFIGVPVALFVARLVLGVAQMIILFPLALLAGKKREFMEFSNFQLAVAESLGSNSLKLRQGRVLLRMFNELPPPSPGEPARSGAELLDLYDEIHAGDEDDDDEVSNESPPHPALT